MVNDSGVVGDHITNDNRLIIEGTAEAGSTVTVFRNGNSIGTAVADGNGDWSLNDTGTKLSDGTYQYTAKATDVAGNTGALSGNYAVTVDTSEPTASVHIAAISQDTGTSSTDFITNDTVLTVSGTNGSLGSGEKVQVSTDGFTWFDATPTDSTHWSYSDPAMHGSDFTYYARVVDAAGNVGDTDQEDVDIDLTPPSTTVAISGIQSDTGVSSSDFVTKDRTLTLNGTYGGSLGSNVIQVSTDGGQTWKNANTSFGSWSYSDPATHADGTFTYQVRVIDVAGNVGSTTSHNVTVDGTAPTIAIATTLAGDNVVNAAEDGSVVISGTTTGAEDGQIVTVTLSDGSHTVTKTASVTNGGWSTSGADISGFNNGNVTVRADVSDLAGNQATQASKVVTLDNVATISIASTIAGDNIVNAAEDGSVVISGATTGVENGRTVTVTLSDGTHTVTKTAVVSNGAWSTSGADISGFTNGNITVHADVSDLAGNAATQASKTITLDNVAPTIAIASTIAGDNIVNAAEDNSVVISGTTSGVENGRTVTVTLSDGVHGAVTTTATVNNNTWTAAGADIHNLNDGNITVLANVSDAAGNAATQASKALALDNAAPTVVVTQTHGGGSGTFTFTFSEAVSGFTLADINTGNRITGTSGFNHVGLNGSGQDVYTLNFTYSSQSGGSRSATVAGSYTDLAGNAGVTGASAELPRRYLRRGDQPGARRHRSRLARRPGLTDDLRSAGRLDLERRHAQFRRYLVGSVQRCRQPLGDLAGRLHRRAGVQCHGELDQRRWQHRHGLCPRQRRSLCQRARRSSPGPATTR